MRFTKLLTFGFWSSFEFSEVRYELHDVVVSQISRRVAKFVASEVRVIRCSWFGSVTTNEIKQIENISKPSGLFYDVYF